LLSINKLISVAVCINTMYFIISHPNLTTGKLHYLTLFFTVITSVERYKF